MKKTWTGQGILSKLLLKSTLMDTESKKAGQLMLPGPSLIIKSA
jgi:hypothetical protein